jgi:hypothetical protein
VPWIVAGLCQYARIVMLNSPAAAGSQSNKFRAQQQPHDERRNNNQRHTGGPLRPRPQLQAAFSFSFLDRAVGATRSASRSRISPRSCKSQASISAEAAFPKSKRASRTWTTKRLSISRRCLKVQVQELFPQRTPGNRLYEFMEKLETTRF